MNLKERIESDLKLHEICKLEGLENLKELSDMASRHPDIFRNMRKKYPDLLRLVIRGAVYEKQKGEGDGR